MIKLFGVDIVQIIHYRAFFVNSNKHCYARQHTRITYRVQAQFLQFSGLDRNATFTLGIKVYVFTLGKDWHYSGGVVIVVRFRLPHYIRPSALETMSHCIRQPP